MRDERANGGPDPARQSAGPPWATPGPRTPADDAVSAGHGAGLGYGTRSSQPRAAPRPRRGRGRRLFLVLGLLAGLAGLAVSAEAAAVQYLPRNFTPAQRQQIMAWEVAKRWSTWPAGRIFPAAIGYRLPGFAFGGGPALPLRAERVGIAAQSSCEDAIDPVARRVLEQRGCVAVLRATYQDATQTLAVTVGVAVMRTASAAGAAAAWHRDAPLQPWLRPVSFRRTTTAHFAGPGHKIGWRSASGPYLVLATVGYADGRPFLSQGHDTYTEAEMHSLVSGVGRSVASGLRVPPSVPSCPGSPGC